MIAGRTTTFEELKQSNYRVRLWKGRYREPDITFAARDRTLGEQFSEGADLLVEIVSEDRKGRKRDLQEKRAEYAAAVPEYWIVDPQEQIITVLTLNGDHYRVHGEFKPGETATSLLLEGFAVEVAACFAAADVE